MRLPSVRLNAFFEVQPSDWGPAESKSANTPGHRVDFK